MKEIVYQPLEKNDYSNHDLSEADHPEIIRFNGELKVKEYSECEWHVEVVVCDRAVVFHFYSMGDRKSVV